MARITAEGKHGQILDAAVRVFARSGYAGARVRTIAQEAGVAEGTLYLYFPSKEKLLIDVFRAGLAGFLASLETSLEGAPTGREALAALMAHHLRYLGQRRDLARLTQIELRQAQADVQRALSDLLHPYLERIDGILERGRADGSLRRDFDRRVARALVYGAADQAVTSWVQSHHPYPLEPVAAELTRLILGGLAGPGPGGPAGGLATGQSEAASPSGAL